MRGTDVRLYALSNWPAEMFPIGRERFPFLRLFDGILISGEAGCAKPAPEIFEAFLERFGLDAERCVFLDDNEANVAAASALGFDAFRFESADRLETELRRRGLLP